MYSLQNKIAVVTGGGSGIGKAIAELFARQGAKIFIMDLNAAAVEEAVHEINSADGKAFAATTNVSDLRKVKDVFASIAQQAGRIDILVNSAGISHIGRLENTSEEDFEKVFQVNVKGVYNLMHASIHQMKQQGGGVILNISSVAAII